MPPVTTNDEFLITPFGLHLRTWALGVEVSLLKFRRSMFDVRRSVF